ncbi:MAG: TlyA family RNA methyltransferase [Deltaproteobacteria bacterium]|nr:TlyA family RNA methyltransferase [Deltaproteobacteria bacterium]
MKRPEKERIDVLLVEKGLAQSRHKAQALVMAGKVLVDGVTVDKAGKEVGRGSAITLKEEMPYVSRGGVKLAGALDNFAVDATGFTVMDVGASTGGFTDCLLKRGARFIYAVDVGKGILDISLRNDPRVRVLEQRNIRHLGPSEIPESVDLAVIDVSFISLEKVLPRVKEFLREGSRVLALIKPQFEVGKGQVGKGGVVRDPEKHREVVEKIKGFSASIGFNVLATAESPITGAKGNREFWIYLGV